MWTACTRTHSFLTLKENAVKTVTRLLLTVATLVGGSARAELPLKAEKTARVDDHAHFMTVRVQVSNGAPGRVDGSIRCYSKHALEGFVGSGVLLFKDGRGNIVYKAATPSVGVNGEYVGNSDREKLFQMDLPDLVRDNVASIELECHNTGQDALALARYNAEALKQLAESLLKK
jgi:hypothetical protein